MKIKTVEFIKGVTSFNALPSGMQPEIAFAGRSNVGKSSMLNSLLGRQKVAKVSKTPGRTREINFFSINECARFVDLPGYGFAKAAGATRALWAPLILRYLSEREQLRAVVLILDVRRTPNDEDLALVDLLREYGVNIITVAGKSDKLPLQQRQKQINIIADTLHLMPHDILQFSALSGAGRDKLWQVIDMFIKSDPGA